MGGQSISLAVTSGSNAGATMTFGGVAMPATEDSTADDPVALSVDSVTREDDKARPSSSGPPNRSKSHKEISVIA